MIHAYLVYEQVLIHQTYKWSFVTAQPSQTNKYYTSQTNKIFKTNNFWPSTLAMEIPLMMKPENSPSPIERVNHKIALKILNLLNYTLIPYTWIDMIMWMICHPCIGLENNFNHSNYIPNLQKMTYTVMYTTMSAFPNIEVKQPVSVSFVPNWYPKLMIAIAIQSIRNWIIIQHNQDTRTYRNPLIYSFLLRVPSPSEQYRHRLTFYCE